MTTRLNPYLNFDSSTREAMEFYRDVFGGELTISTFGEMNMAAAPADENKIMHSQLSGGEIEFMAADTPTGMPTSEGNSVTMALFGEDEPKLTGYFDRLADGGTTTMALAPVPWGATFGMCTDRFGVAWMVNIEQS